MDDGTPLDFDVGKLHILLTLDTFLKHYRGTKTLTISRYGITTVTVQRYAREIGRCKDMLFLSSSSSF